MIAEVIPGAYDSEGKKVFRPFDRHKGPRPTFPLGRSVSQPLANHCHSIEDIREFLMGCTAVSDKELSITTPIGSPRMMSKKRRKAAAKTSRSGPGASSWTWAMTLASSSADTEGIELDMRGFSLIRMGIVF